MGTPKTPSTASSFIVVSSDGESSKRMPKRSRAAEKSSKPGVSDRYRRSRRIDDSDKEGSGSKEGGPDEEDGSSEGEEEEGHSESEDTDADGSTDDEEEDDNGVALKKGRPNKEETELAISTAKDIYQNIVDVSRRINRPTSFVIRKLNLLLPGGKVAIRPTEWARYVGYFHRHLEEERERVGDPDLQNPTKEHFNSFKEAYGNSYADILDTDFTLSKSRIHSNLGERQRAFTSYCGNIIDLITAGEMLGFETVFAACGSVVNEDGNLGTYHQTKHLSGFLSKISRRGMTSDSFIGQMKAQSFHAHAREYNSEGEDEIEPATETEAEGKGKSRAENSMDVDIPNLDSDPFVELVKTRLKDDRCIEFAREYCYLYLTLIRAGMGNRKMLPWNGQLLKLLAVQGVAGHLDFKLLRHPCRRKKSSDSKPTKQPEQAPTSTSVVNTWSRAVKGKNKQDTSHQSDDDQPLAPPPLKSKKKKVEHIPLPKMPAVHFVDDSNDEQFSPDSGDETNSPRIRGRRRQSLSADEDLFILSSGEEQSNSKKREKAEGKVKVASDSKTSKDGVENLAKTSLAGASKQHLEKKLATSTLKAREGESSTSAKERTGGTEASTKKGKGKEPKASTKNSEGKEKEIGESGG
ncbi:hypothetical protein H1R20_g13425, partial [Candolleomyces eurysporus]